MNGIHIYHHIQVEGAALGLLEKIMATQAELAQQLTDIRNQLQKASGEIQARVAALEAAIAAAGNTSPAVDAALADVKAIAQALDDLNPDAPTP